MGCPPPDPRTRRRPGDGARPSFVRSHLSSCGGAAVSPQDIATYARSLSLIMLGTWLLEVDETHAEPGYFPCPRCQRTARDQLAQAPRAHVSPTGLSWQCTRCRASGTHETLALAALARPAVVEAMAGHLLGGGRD